MARWTETLRAPGLIPITPAASSDDNSRIFTNSIAFRWPAERRLMASLRASGSP